LIANLGRDPEVRTLPIRVRTWRICRGRWARFMPFRAYGSWPL